MSWKYFRDSYSAVKSAVDRAHQWDDAWPVAALAEHPTVKLALQQIDMAERAIASVADELLAKRETDATR